MVEKQSILYGAAGFIFMLLGSLVFVKILEPEKSALNALLDPSYWLIITTLFGFLVFGYRIGKK